VFDTAFMYSLGIRRILIGVVGIGSYSGTVSGFSAFSGGILAGYYF
jgi:hypothetical protein